MHYWTPKPSGGEGVNKKQGWAWTAGPLMPRHHLDHEPFLDKTVTAALGEHGWPTDKGHSRLLATWLAL